ncbi:MULTISPECIES: cell division protein FtsQ/DivIB [unclassified Rhodococcus (in: high G+C Gram-positive bacteria)]|uniref:cell division protein FtsQ/DivIB n=1 Tax=unclassified Rhodococcus (in: high G+C Gram-positive bacteria) TaxID=192944 RepID=UPI000271F891|nr:MULTISPECIES: FtsQ-type POTRA domain-containing protein [unclassified Rhodococcus (in: high G+C Gram-positive bacteria)]EJJ00895.1 cell division protein FtsQ family protein [Rhodococcus sp. JVH1]
MTRERRGRSERPDRPVRRDVQRSPRPGAAAGARATASDRTSSRRRTSTVTDPGTRRTRESASAARKSAVAETPRRPWYRRPAVMGAVGVVVVVALGLVAWFTPLLSVRKTDVAGAASISEEQIRQVLAVPQGQPLLRVDTEGAAQRVAAIPKVASARVQRVYPSTIRVTVTERVPVVFVDSPGGTHLLDAEAVDYEIAPPPPGVPRLVTGSPGWGDPSTEAAIEVLESMPPQLRGQVGQVAAKSISDISVTLLDGRIVVWGGTEKSERKAAVTLPLLTQPGQTYDVSSPDLPTVR